VEDFKATQREIAEAVGRSPSWVNRLLKWHRSGYKQYSPFGPTTKAGRVSHAQQRAKASKPRRKPPSGQANSTASADAGTSTTADAGTSTTAEAGTSTTGAAGAAASAGAGSSTSKRPSPEEAKGNLIYAIDTWWRYLDDTGKVDVTAYFLKKTGARVS
jgi:cytoskeletal protein RodZ